MDQCVEALPSTESQTAAARVRGISAVTSVVLAGCLVNAALGSKPLVDWAGANPELPDWVGRALGDWDAALTRVGLSELHPLVRHLVEQALGQ